MRCVSLRVVHAVVESFVLDEDIFLRRENKSKTTKCTGQCHVRTDVASSCEVGMREEEMYVEQIFIEPHRTGSFQCSFLPSNTIISAIIQPRHVLDTALTCSVCVCSHLPLLLIT